MDTSSRKNIWINEDKKLVSLILAMVRSNHALMHDVR